MSRYWLLKATDDALAAQVMELLAACRERHKVEIVEIAPERRGLNWMDNGLVDLDTHDVEWLQYAVDHLRDDSEPEDLGCANAIEAMLNRLRPPHG